MVPIKDETGGVIFEASDNIPEEIAREAFKNLNCCGLLPGSKNFDEEFLDDVERLISE